MFPSTPNPTLDPPIHSRFTVIYDALPESAKRALLEDHLLPLIDALPSASKRTLLSSAHALQARLTQLPPLSLLNKKAEINVLLEELRLDSYRSPASSRREEISEEIIDSIVYWLSDIWQTVYEVGVEFENGHQCLLYCCEVLQQISIIGSRCKCHFMNLYMSPSIRDRSGRMIKEFSYTNVYLLDDAFLWIWRDMLLRILADGRKSELEAIPRMLRDIQSATKEWETALDRILVAGRQFRFHDNERHMDPEYLSPCCLSRGSKYCHRCPNNAQHWPSSIQDQLPNLRTHISTALCESFVLHPSLSFYTTILSLTPTSRSSLLEHLQSTAPYSAAAAAAALDIHAYDKDATALLATLSAARPVLRARDAPALQRAARLLMNISADTHFHTACDLVERELRACVDAIRGAVLSRGFGGLENAPGKALWEAVEWSAVGSAQRKDAVGRWVDAVATDGQPGVVAGHTVNFAALLMGLPPNFDPNNGDPDPFIFSTIKEGHPDYEDLIEEWRPRLKERFEGWVLVAESLKGVRNKESHGGRVGVELIRRVTAQIIEQMPWVGEEDVVLQMIGRIQDKPTKHHICAALEALLLFMLDQQQQELRDEWRRKMATNAKVRKAAKNSTRGVEGTNGGLNVLDNSHGAGSSSANRSSNGEQSQTATKKMSAVKSMKEFLHEVHEKSGNPRRLWGPRGRGASASSLGTRSVGGRTVSGASAMGSKTEGRKEKDYEQEKEKAKEREQQPSSLALTSRYTAEEKGKGKAVYPVTSSIEEPAVGPVLNDNRELPPYCHASEDVAGGSSFLGRGHELEAQPPGERRQARSPSLSVASMPGLEPI